MPLEITDAELEQAGISARDARIELACRLFDIGRLPLWPAARLAGLRRVEFEPELRSRKIPVYRPSLEDFLEDLETLRGLEIAGAHRQ